MARLLLFAALGCVLWKMFTGRWPWQAKPRSTRQQAIFNARQLLGIPAAASRIEVVDAHRRLIAMVHPDRGGTNAQVHEANAARDILLSELPDPAEEIR